MCALWKLSLCGLLITLVDLDQLGDHLELHLHRISQRLFLLRFLNVLKKKIEKQKSNSCPHVLGRCGIVSECLVCRDSVPSFLETA